MCNSDFSQPKFCISYLTLRPPPPHHVIKFDIQIQYLVSASTCSSAKWEVGVAYTCIYYDYLRQSSICALCPDKMLDPLGHHATTCKRGGDVVFRHNRLRDILAETCRRAHFSVQLEAGCNLTPDHSHSRPADVLISNWALGKKAACDISVTSPLNSNIMFEAGVTAGAAAQATELRKHEANDVKCSELGWLCIPLVVESYGAWGKEAIYGGIFKSSLSPSHNIIKAQIYRSIRAVWPAQSEPCKG